MLTEDIQQHASQYLMNTYSRLPVAFIRGRGCKLYDAEGREYLDCVAGIAVTVLGHAHPELVTAVERQMRQLTHVSNLFYTEPQVRLAELLVKNSFADKVFFCNSGAEANEAALKLARRYATRKYGADRYEVVTFHNSFHGRTLATLSATGQPKVHQGFEPLVPGFHFATFNDMASVEKLVTDHTAAIMVEPIQAEGGVHVAQKEFLEHLRELCTERGMLLIFDEVQTGMGRTGTLFAYEQFGVRPDIMTLAKGLGGGVPIGACLAIDEIAQAFEPGTHASTFGGNPLACSAALAVFDVLLNGELEKSRAKGEYFRKGLRELQSRIPLIREVRGLGFLQGLELSIDGKPVVQDCLARRVVINCTSDRVLRFVPPLIITEPEIDHLLATLSTVLNKRL